MKLMENQRNKFARRHSARSRPYDLRRKVLVSNFLKDQTPYPSKSTSKVQSDSEIEEPHDASVSSAIKKTEESLVSNQDDSVSEADFDIDSNAENTSNDSLNNNYSPETKEFLHLVSRRLKISESSKITPSLSEGSQYATRSSVKSQSSSSSSESESANFKGYCSKRKKFNERLNRCLHRSTKSAGELRPLRSYPTFDKLNEIFDNDKSQLVMKKSLPKNFNGKNKRRRNGKRVTSKKKLLRNFKKMFKKINIHSEHSPSSSGSEEINEKRDPKMSVSQIPETVRNTQITDNVAPERITRSKFFNNKNKLHCRSESFKAKSNIFSLAAYKSAALL